MDMIQINQLEIELCSDLVKRSKNLEMVVGIGRELSWY